MKAQAIVTSQGRIVSLDIAVNYCHDMKLFKMSRRNIGQAGKILADSGYQGPMKIYPQAQTPRKSSKLKPVLAIVSNSYPPLPGRLPTRYSPVRNSSREASSSFSVLLACIRHAASVRPEPGSNSH
ncbi:transposase [Streptococcus pneumoniae]|nr:transposase [Streptococcus pneumoniae]